MTVIEINTIENAVYPISVYISDIYKNNNSLIGTITTDPGLGGITFDTTIPSIFQSADQILITLIDTNGCEVMKLFNCIEEILLQIVVV